MLDIESVPLDDTNVWKMIGEGRVKGLFQVESQLSRQWCKKLKPQNILELSALISLVRPGCLRGLVDGKTMANRYHDRKHGLEPVEYLHPSLEPILKDTYGVIVYQEQIMRIARDLCGFNSGEVNELRKSIGKKDAHSLFKLEQRFIDGAIKQNIISKEIAEKLFSAIKASARYLFNKSHAVDYAKVSYQTGYAKFYKPIKFYKNWLRWASEKIDPKQEKKELILSAKEDGIEILPPSLDLLNPDFIINDNKIYFGFCAVKGIGESKFNKLELKKHEKWKDMLFMLANHDPSVMDNLVKIGTFAGYGKSRNEVLHELSVLRELTTKEMEGLQEKYNEELSLLDNLKTLAKVKKEGGIVHSVKGLEKFNNLIQKLENPGRSLKDNPAYFATIEKELLGTPLSCSELDDCADASFANSTCSEFKNGGLEEAILAVSVVSFREHTIKKSGELMCFLTVQDDSGELDNIVIFPSAYEEISPIIYNNSKILIQGKRSSKNKNSFVIEKAYQI